MGEKSNGKFAKKLGETPTTMGFSLLKIISTWGVKMGVVQYHHLRKHSFLDPKGWVLKGRHFSRF